MEDFQGTGQKVIFFYSFPSRLPFASPSSRVQVGFVEATWDASLHAWLSGVQGRNTVAAEWGLGKELPFRPT